MALPPEDARPLSEADLDPDPLGQFRRWFEEASASVRMPEAAALATADRSGRPSARMVLVKAFDERGFEFYTNYESRKGCDLTENPRCAMLFYWDPLGRQVRIEGAAERVAPERSDEYFATRPRGGQIAAHTSEQSRPIESRDELDRRQRELAERLEGGPVPRPAWWGGFRLSVETFEFWQNREDRLHDRLRYSRAGEGWRIERLQP